MTIAKDYSKPERDIDSQVIELMAWGSTTLGLGCDDVSTDDLTRTLTEEITTEQLQHAFTLALDNKNTSLGDFLRDLLTDQARLMIEHEDKKAA